MTSPRIAKLTWPAEVFYRRLHSVVDDFGRYYGDPMLLRAGCYPRQLDKVSDSDIGKWIRETVEAGLVRGFEHEEQRYLEVLDFRQKVRANKSKFPQPPPLDEQMHSRCIADAPQMLAKTETYSKAESERPPGASRLEIEELPSEWVAFCRQERQDLDPLQTFARFRDYWIAKPGKDGRKVDWTATWRNWVRNEKTGQVSPTNRGPQF